MSNVKIVRLMTGEELIGSVSTSPDGDVVVKDVAQVQMVPLQNGNVTVAMMPFAPYAEDEQFTLNREHVTMALEGQKKYDVLTFFLVLI